MQTYNTTGGKIRLLIDKLGIKDKEFAALINTTPQTLSKILNDKYPLSKKMAKRIANALNTTEEFLLYNEDDLDANQEPDYYCSQENLDTNRQFYRISQARSFLNSLHFSFIEKVIFENEEFTFNYDEDRMFSSSHDPNLEYAEHEIIDIINRSADIPKHIMEIGYNDSVQQMEYSDYLKWIVNFIESSRALALQQFHNIPEPQIFLDDIDKAISEHARKIAQGTWQPPSKEEDEQRLLHAIYGENIPENPKKEE